MIDDIRNTVRAVMDKIARVMNSASGGRVTPNQITMLGFFLHMVVAWFIIEGDFVVAAFGLAVFGLFDALDGALARLQKKDSSAGMVLDATTDRMKEGVVYAAIAYHFAEMHESAFVALSVIALAGSFAVSYSKAKGETALVDAKLTANEKNRVFSDGFMRFEIRMFALVLGLLTNQLVFAVAFVAVFAWQTAIFRIIAIQQKVSA